MRYRQSTTKTSLTRVFSALSIAMFVILPVITTSQEHALIGLLHGIFPRENDDRNKSDYKSFN
jgi:hypothetical protein